MNEIQEQIQLARLAKEESLNFIHTHIAPRLGQRVHYVLANGEHRPAVVVNGPFPGNLVNLQVFIDLFNDIPSNIAIEKAKRYVAPENRIEFVRLLGGTITVGSVYYDQTGKTPGTWHHEEVAG